VGPPRFQISAQQARIVEEILAVLPERLTWNYIQSYQKQVAEVQPEAYWRTEAPREAISSHLIAGALDECFHLETTRPYGGAVLNPLLSQIVGNFDPEIEGDVSALRLLAAFERILMKEADLPSDFAVLAARSRS
jgi:hypothetical protein